MQDDTEAFPSLAAFVFNVTRRLCSAGLLEIESLPRGVMCALLWDEGSYSHIAHTCIHTSWGIKGLSTCWMCTHVARHATPAIPVSYLLPRGVVVRSTPNNQSAKGQDLFHFTLYQGPKGHQNNLTNTRSPNTGSLYNPNQCRYNHICTASSAACVNYFDRPHYSFIQDEKTNCKDGVIMLSNTLPLMDMCAVTWFITCICLLLVAFPAEIWTFKLSFSHEYFACCQGIEISHPSKSIVCRSEKPGTLVHFAFNVYVWMRICG